MKQVTTPSKQGDDLDSHDDTLLEDQDIPLLEETVEETGQHSDEEMIDDSDIITLPIEEIVDESDVHSEKREQDIATLEAIVFDGVDPKEAKNLAKAKASPTEATKASPDTGEVPEDRPVTQETTPSPAPSIKAPAAPVFTPPKQTVEPHDFKPLPKTSNNPFLPQHILDRLNQGRRNLVEEIAQSGAALDASTAALRSRTRKPEAPPSPHHETIQHGTPRDGGNFRQQQLIDDLVEEYLPLIAAELRKRLKKILDEQKQ